MEKKQMLSSQRVKAVNFDMPNNNSKDNFHFPKNTSQFSRLRIKLNKPFGYIILG
jgi:hypothetical protein